jgi:Schlafen, AlbA_2
MAAITKTTNVNSMRSRLLDRAENAQKESRHLDFKSEFDVDSTPQWCEVIKDIVSVANSGGGVIIFGVNDDGSAAGFDTSRIFKLDVADLTNKIEAYTGYHFAEIEIVEVERRGDVRAAFIIGGADIPIVFTRPGADVAVKGKQRPAFAKGTVYFRHGAKSEPGTRNDLIIWRDRAIEKARRNWVKGIRKVIEAPAGHTITVVSSPPAGESGILQPEGMSISAEISAAPGAVRIVPRNAEELWPFRQKDLLYEVNKEIKTSPPINGYDILCVNSELGVLKNHPEFAYKPHRLASPQYSKEYAAWIIEQFKQDSKFFKRMREEYKTRT